MNFLCSFSWAPKRKANLIRPWGSDLQGSARPFLAPRESVVTSALNSNLVIEFDILMTTNMSISTIWLWSKERTITRTHTLITKWPCLSSCVGGSPDKISLFCSYRKNKRKEKLLFHNFFRGCGAKRGISTHSVIANFHCLITVPFKPSNHYHQKITYQNI